jgi:CheY-like chemotaxis protein
MAKILVVEDEATLRDSYELILSTAGYATHVAADGLEALGLCAATKFDLILLDIMMPHMDGVEFLKRFRQDDKTTRVVVMSNLSSGDELSRAMALGADRSVVKADVSPRQLLDMVREEVGV